MAKMDPVRAPINLNHSTLCPPCSICCLVLTPPPLPPQSVKNLPAMLETWVRSLGWEGPLKKEMATHSSILAWRIPWTEEPGGLQSMGSQSRTRLSALSLSVSLFYEVRRLLLSSERVPGSQIV